MAKLLDDRKINKICKMWEIDEIVDNIQIYFRYTYKGYEGAFVSEIIHALDYIITNEIKLLKIIIL